MPRGKGSPSIHDPVFCALDRAAYEQWSASLPQEDVLLRRALPKAFERELTSTQRKYAIDYYVQQKTMVEIAEKYGVHYSTVSRVLSSARNRLKHVLRYASVRTLDFD